VLDGGDVVTAIEDLSEDAAEEGGYEAFEAAEGSDDQAS